MKVLFRMTCRDVTESVASRLDDVDTAPPISAVIQINFFFENNIRV